MTRLIASHRMHNRITSHRTHQVIGESLYWPRVPMAQQAKRKTKRTFKVYMCVRSGVNNIGPMTFTAFLLEAGMVTDLQQKNVTVETTPGKSLFFGGEEAMK